ncbi:MAG: hypothetical protein H6716_11420 [Polyangiaceae bacterium]|nr:hypothetical protein [Polyangiaceae bacterium]
MIIVFASDGEPTDCETDISRSLNVAAGLRDPPVRPTPLASATSALDTIAAAGGSQKAIVVDTRPAARTS